MTQNTLEHNDYSAPASTMLALETSTMILAGSFEPDSWTTDQEEF